jgi:protein-tyrosine phosphatase
MFRIARGLYLGDRRDAQDRDLLRGLGVTHVLNCAREVPCWHRTDFRYLHLPLTDPDPEFCESIEAVCRFIRVGRRAGGVLVHCAAGISRSPSAVLAYLCSRGRSLDDALDLLRRRVGESDGGFIEPDAGFLEQIEVYFEER